MRAEVCIAATGARTPLGLHCAGSAAACRAAISATATHPYMIDRAGEPMPAALDSLLDADATGAQRLLALAVDPLLEACAPLGLDVDARRFALPLYLGLTEPPPGFTVQDAQAVRSRIAQTVGLPVTISEVHVAPQGHAAGVAALSAAAARIRDGELRMCLAGGIDSYIHPDTLEWLDDNRQLLGTVSRSGFVPGEGAGFCLLVSDRTREELGLPALARVARGAVGRETKGGRSPERNCLGEGLSAVIASVIADMPDPASLIDAVYCDQNGERHRGEEWGFVCLRLGRHFRDPTAYHSPADCWGDVGAASGPLFAGLACQAFERGYAEGPIALLCAGSESGMRAAIVLTSLPNETR